jgi:hypothetical protein
MSPATSSSDMNAIPRVLSRLREEAGMTEYCARSSPFQRQLQRCPRYPHTVRHRPITSLR